MQVYLAPMQGLTDWIFRESYIEHIGKFDKTFAPFIRVQNGEFYRPSQCNDILPEHNTLQKPVPQFLGNDTASFQRFEDLCLEHQYTEVNINLGCPFIKVLNKGMGAGMLSHPDKMAAFFSKIFATTKLSVSVKCRLGQDNVTDFEPLIPIFNDFPILEMIIHPRIAKQMYKGEIYSDAFARYALLLKHPVCYNGDILSISDIDKIKLLSPQVESIMIGRGILQNPFLLDQIKKQDITRDEKISRLMAFHLSLIEFSKQKYSGDLNLIRRFEELWAFHAEGFEKYHSVVFERTVEEAAIICGIDEKDIRLAASYIGNAKGFITMWTMGLNQSVIGVNKNLSLINLNLITGHIGKSGSGPFSLTGQPNAMGGREVGGLSNLLSAHRLATSSLQFIAI